jgi:hypothetical protein
LNRVAASVTPAAASAASATTASWGFGVDC